MQTNTKQKLNGKQMLFLLKNAIKANTVGQSAFNFDTSQEAKLPNQDCSGAVIVTRGFEVHTFSLDHMDGEYGLYCLAEYQVTDENGNRKLKWRPIYVSVKPTFSSISDGVSHILNAITTGKEI